MMMELLSPLVGCSLSLLSIVVLGTGTGDGIHDDD